jgi:hypothetical protein
MGNQKRFNEEELKNIVKDSYTYAGVLKKLGIVPAGGNYTTIKYYIKLWSIDISDFTKQRWSKGKTLPNRRRPISELLVYGNRVKSYKLKNRLLGEKIFIYKCSKCNLIEWLGKPIPLELHHIDGDPLNNLIDNLCLICPNCHALTDNYRGKNIPKNNLFTTQDSVI